jgi:hypothetical protein
VRRAAGQHLVADGGQRPHVGGRTRGPAARDGRVDVLGRAVDGGLPLPRDAGHPQVSEQRHAVGGEQHVGRRDVPVHQPARVRGRQRLGERPADRHHLARVERTAAGQQGRQRAAGGVVEDQDRPGTGADDVAQPDDVGGVQVVSSAASLRSASTAAGSASGRSRLSATVSPVASSRARHTSPVAPKPSSACTS